MGIFMSRSSPDFIVHVQTGDRAFSGTDSVVEIVFEDEHGNQSEPFGLDSFAKNDFERGSFDTFNVPANKVEMLQGTAKITNIEVWKGSCGFGSDWFVDKIVVENRNIRRSFEFPILRWIRSNQTLYVSRYDTSLPQDDEYTEQRLHLLVDKKKEYQLVQKIPNGPVQVKCLPPDEHFSFNYLFQIGTLKASLIADSFVQNIGKNDFAYFSDFYSLYDGFAFTRPADLDVWESDYYFGYQRLGRVNHSVIELARDIPFNFPISDDLLKAHLDGLTIREAMRQKRLFIINYKILDGIAHKEGCTVCAPIALFFSDSKGLRPVAIQLNQVPCPENPIFTPECTRYVWTLVKMWFNSADACYHQSLSHLGLTHLLMEGFTLATQRELSQSHPIFKLLGPHFLYLLSINSLALTVLLQDGGWVDQIMGCGRDGMYDIINRGYDKWRLDVDGTLPNDLKKRGLEDPDVLPNYDYRNDGLLLYEAILKYVTAYVNLYYPTVDKLLRDTEIQAWARVLVKPKNGARGGMGYKGIPGNGTLSNNGQLIQILTCVIYTCSVGHAATNFPQYEEYAFPPKYPSMMKGKPPTDTTDVSETELVAHLADRNKTLDVMSMMKILSTRGTKSLGDFEVQYIFEPKACILVEEFRKNLANISRVITERNSHRQFDYDYLNPNGIPNAISI